MLCDDDDSPDDSPAEAVCEELRAIRTALERPAPAMEMHPTFQVPASPAPKVVVKTPAYPLLKALIFHRDMAGRITSAETVYHE